MPPQDSILELLEEKSAEALQRARRAVILQPGAIGDCILTLPLANFLKSSLELGSIDMFGLTDYIGIFPGRTVIDGVRSLDSVDLHRLFTSAKDFELDCRDRLAETFDGYSWIVSFLGESGSDFEKNLIYTVHSSHSAEVITLALKPDEGFSGHITEFYTSQFQNQYPLELAKSDDNFIEPLIRTKSSDRKLGAELLIDAGFDSDSEIVIIHPGSGATRKCWNLANFIAVAKKLGSCGFDVLFILGPAEQERFNHATLAAIYETGVCLSDLSLTEVLGVLSCASAFIGNDSGVTHLAAALGVKTVALFGPTNPSIYRPLGPYVTIHQIKTENFADIPCEAEQNKVAEAILK